MCVNPRIFISYSRSDKANLEEFLQVLNAAHGSTSVWYDKNLQAGVDFWRHIQKEIARCNIFIFLISDKALTSAYCLDEFKECLRLKKVFIPVRITSESISTQQLQENIQHALASTQQINLIGANNKIDAMEMAKLNASIGNILKRKCRRKIYMVAAILFVFVFCLFFIRPYAGVFLVTKTVVPPFAIYDAHGVATGFAINVDTSSRISNWISYQNEFLRMDYPPHQDWGVVFFNAGSLKPLGQREGRDFSAYDTLAFDLRGELGGESISVGAKTTKTPDNGSEIKILFQLTKQWKTYFIALSDIGLSSEDLKEIYIPMELVFGTSLQPSTIYVRNIYFFQRVN